MTNLKQENIKANHRFYEAEQNARHRTNTEGRNQKT